MVILDTDILTHFFDCGSLGLQIIARLNQLPTGSVATTIVSYEEQTRGRLAYVSRSKTVAKNVEAYNRLQNHLRCFLKMPVVAFTESAAVEFQQLQKLKLRVGTMDLRIAAIALSMDATLLTRNLQDFEKVPGLKFEDWTKP